MDTRTRLERKIDKMMEQKRKMMEIEAQMKVPKDQEDDYLSPNKENARPGCGSSKRKAKPKARPMIKMSRKRETQTMLQINAEFVEIGSGRPSLKADSAGHKLDSNYHMRIDQRLLLTAALTTGDQPAGARNVMAIATRIEAAIWNILRNDSQDYFQYCNIVANYIKAKEHRPIRHALLLGWTDADEFAFVPSVGTELRDRIAKQIKSKEAEDKEKIRVLKKNSK